MKKSKNKDSVFGLSPIGTAVYIALAFLLAVFQTTVGKNIAILGAVPQLTLALTCAAGYFYGAAAGGTVGIVAGVFTSALGTVGISVLPLFYCVIGFLTGLFAPPKKTNFIRFIMALAATCAVGIAITIISLALGAGRPNIALALLHIALPEALNTFIYGTVIGLVHLLIKFIQNRKTQ